MYEQREGERRSRQIKDKRAEGSKQVRYEIKEQRQGGRGEQNNEASPVARG